MRLADKIVLGAIVIAVLVVLVTNACWKTLFKPKEVEDEEDLS